MLNLGIIVHKVGRVLGAATLNPGETKNDAGRTLYLSDELREIIDDEWEERKQRKRLAPYVFTNRSGKVGGLVSSLDFKCV